SRHRECLSQSLTNAKGGAPILIDTINCLFNFNFFCRQRLRALVGIACLSQHRDCLSQSLTNAKC
ncbi:MAG: hypothetical protein MPJ53_00440, partial [Alphaproteobacteria bacterium]|nr:hypothetical protein [Alphaproteobacteria bacterium]